MSENSSPVTPDTATTSAQSPVVVKAGTSRLALLISFVAGAFAAWLVITNNVF